ncbi:MAG: class I SAM-dependent methyltransferase [Saccharofermentanales bacterium]
MNYNESNKTAWEEAYDNRKDGWGEDIVAQIRNERYPFLRKELLDELAGFDFKGKTIAQFCCNNGRELFSLFKMGAECGVGFDIAENMVSFANSTAKELQMNCSFVATDIFNIDSAYYGAFDYILITIGALTWFEDLKAFFNKTASCLKDGGYLVINEKHPVTDMLAMEGEENFDASLPDKLINSYFRQEPWIESNGMGYMSDSSKDYKKTFYSYSHTFADIMNAIIDNGMQIRKLKEFDFDISSSFCNLDHKGIPLSYILISQK